MALVLARLHSCFGRPPFGPSTLVLRPPFRLKGISRVCLVHGWMALFGLCTVRCKQRVSAELRLIGKLGPKQISLRWTLLKLRSCVGFSHVSIACVLLKHELLHSVVLPS